MIREAIVKVILCSVFVFFLVFLHSSTEKEREREWRQREGVILQANKLCSKSTYAFTFTTLSPHTIETTSGEEKIVQNLMKSLYLSLCASLPLILLMLFVTFGRPCRRAFRLVSSASS